LAAGGVTPATVADHVVPHGGDWNKFLLGELQSLCASCHSVGKQFEEIHGYNPDIGLDGFPLDPRHPVYNLDELGKSGSARRGPAGSSGRLSPF
jgi:hypothetical protein